MGSTQKRLNFNFSLHYHYSANRWPKFKKIIVSQSVESWYNAELSGLINKERTEIVWPFRDLTFTRPPWGIRITNKTTPALDSFTHRKRLGWKTKTEYRLTLTLVTDDHSEVNYGISPPPPPSQSNTQIEMAECNSRLTSRWMNLPRKRVWICLFRFSMERREEGGGGGGGGWGWFCLLIS